jgi:diacylglycerol O-acyltransferase
VPLDRLSALDASFLYLEQPSAPMHVGSVAVFEPPDVGFDHTALTGLIEQRIGLVPRFRQKVRWVPGRVANPVWIDDPDFDLGYHVRRSALPRPGSDEQLRELVARLMSRPLDTSRPLWEMYLVEGLQDGRVALVTKTHHVLVDGVSTVDISTVILDPTPRPRELPRDDWRPRPEPSRLGLVAGAVTDLLRSPTAALETARANALDVRATTEQVLGAVGGVLTAGRPAPSSPINGRLGQARRFGVARTRLEDYRRVRKEHGGTVNDVVLAVVAGALRTWLLSRGEPVLPSSTLRAMVPVSVRQEGHAAGGFVRGYVVDLPVGEPSPVVRLARVGYAMRGHKESDESVGADVLVGLKGFAPPTIHTLGARVASQFTRRLYNLAITNVPGPQVSLYAGGARMVEVFPVVPLANGQQLSIGVNSYDGGVYYGMNADRDAMPDIDVLSQLVEESLAELLGTLR